MKTVQSVLREEVRQLKEMVRRANGRLKKVPKGSLRVANKQQRVDYYYKSEKNAKWVYLKKSELSRAKVLAQRDYDLQMIKLGSERIRAIEQFLKKYDETNVQNIYENTNPGRCVLLSEHVMSDEEYAVKWQQMRYEGKDFAEEVNEIITEKGERVRSKSEKIIADKLYALGIPYRYECPLVLHGNITVYPDFTILRVATREEVYLEHFGMMNDEVYVEKTMNKLATYEKNGIYLGVNLFMTFETGKRVLNMRALDDLLRKLFCEDKPRT